MPAGIKRRVINKDIRGALSRRKLRVSDEKRAIIN